MNIGDFHLNRLKAHKRSPFSGPVDELPVKIAGIIAAQRVRFLIAALFILQSVPCLAGGILHVFPPQVEGTAFAVARPTLLVSRALITISESTIEYRLEQTFYNNNEVPVTGLYVLPLGTEIPRSGPDVWIDGIRKETTVTDSASFFPTLKKLTREMQDPSLLGLAGQELVFVRHVIVGARQQKSFRVKYTRHLSLEHNQLEILLALDGERYSLGPVGRLEIQLRFKVSRPIRTVFSPSHQLSVYRETPNRWLVTAGFHGMRVTRDFRLLALFGGDELDMRLFTHRSPGRQGAFMLFLLPPSQSRQAEQAAKDVIFLMDVSGSMGEKYLRMAKKVVAFCLERLRPEDRFNVLTIGTRVAKMAETLMPATRTNVRDALHFVNSREPQGGSDLYNGLIGALEQFNSRRRRSIVMLVGDGRGTVGITDPETMVRDIRLHNRFGARIFALGLGDPVDIANLDRVTVATRGTCLHFPDKENFESTMNRFFTGVSPPEVSELVLHFDHVAVDEIQPDPLPDLFHANGMIVLGRYSDEDDTMSKVRLTAKVKGTRRTSTKRFTFPAVDQSHPYIPALWAMRRLAQLLERELAAGSDASVTKQIESLSQEFGFRQPLPIKTSGPNPRHTAASIDLGESLWTLTNSNVISDVTSKDYRRVNGKLFRLEENGWVDTRYRPTLPTARIHFLSDRYFSLLETSPEIGPYLALGTDIIWVQGESAISIISSFRDASRAEGNHCASPALRADG